LTNTLNALLKAPFLRTSEVGLTVYDLTADTLLYAYRAEKRTRPASVQKVMTSVAALSTLGTEYTLRTTLTRQGELHGDTLAGRLTVVGGLDPLFAEEDLKAMTEAVRKQGIGCVEGDIVGDVSMKDSMYWGPGWSWDDAPYTFQPYISPLMLNEGCVEVTVTPAERDSLPTVEVRPASDFYFLRNEARSHQPQAGKLRVERDWMTGGRTLLISGNAEKTVRKTLPLGPSHEAFIAAFRHRIPLIPNADKAEISTAEASIQPLLTLSRPIGEVLTRALKKSDNLCAEALFFHLAKARTEGTLSWDAAAEVLTAFAADSLDIPRQTHTIVDGSGVSLYDYTTPSILLAYLKHAYRRPQWFPVFYQALPIAGVDGTLANRMKGTKAEGNVHAKTGSVTGISTLAGYVTAANGHLLAFVIMNQNVATLKEARQWQDAVCKALAE
jgi:D-alanyl-D-alanine carboxypeptidase/D-alanyl-D-alanine-endopeptidase (penicillin-binding protein 4)